MTTLVIQPYRLVDARSLRYQEQNSPQTLAQGLAEYYRENDGIVTRPELLPDQSASLFSSHDICHVIFGLDTSLADEMIADIRTTAACALTWSQVRQRYTDQQALAVFSQMGLWRAVTVPIRSLPRIASTLVQSFLMPKRWPWVPPREYLDRSLADLRAEYRIRVL
ncbi:MAG: hypothetical protein ISS15_07570 [Alphaproteobacteria bacterium]|nr:hypothetical protein [Alphaproteobacteria bacterium]MBL7097499.1 hypothetical protein [Alphaproteobacteria bacterium]